MPTLAEKLVAANDELKKAHEQVAYWTTRRDAFIGRLEALLELQAEQTPPKEE